MIKMTAQCQTPLRKFIILFIVNSLLTLSQSFTTILPKTISSPSPFIKINTQQSQSQRKLQSQLYVKQQQQQQNQKKDKPKKPKSILSLDDDSDEEPMEEVYGAKFFGGSAQKEELYDPVEETQADKSFARRPDTQSKLDFTDDELARTVMRRWQLAINAILHDDFEGEEEEEDVYAPGATWITPLEHKESLPLDELRSSLDYYRDIQLALLSGTTLSSSSVSIRWELSLLWPNVWQSHVLLTGTSTLTLDSSSSDNKITRQEDFLDVTPLYPHLISQLQPRFWDVYHIGMTPVAATTPHLPSSSSKSGGGFLSPYELFDLPPRIVYRPRLPDTNPEGRAAREAQALPNHGFTTIIKTMGPTKQEYVTTSPIEVAIESCGKEGEERRREIVWTVTVPPLVSSRLDLPLPSRSSEEELREDDDDPEDIEGSSTSYDYDPRRRVATMSYGGYPQDEEVSAVRKRLYEAVVADGLRLKLNEDGQPRFFFWQNDAKACFVSRGLGMAVYDWRPKVAGENRVGIELEVD